MKRSLKNLTLIALSLCLPITQLTNNNEIGVNASSEYSLTPIIHYQFDDSANLGKDSANGFDLITKGNVVKTEDGIKLDGSSYLYYAPVANADFTDSLEKFTITLWAKEDAVAGSHRFMLGTGVAHSQTGLGMGFYETNCAYIVPVGGADGYAANFVTSSNDHFGPYAQDYNISTEWNLYTIILQNGQSYFGVNGHLYNINTNIDMQKIKNLAQTFTIGGITDNNNTAFYNGFKGEIKDVRVYDDVLTEAEFKSIYDGGNVIRTKNIVNVSNSSADAENPYDFVVEANDMTETAILNALNNVDVKVKLSDDSEVNANVIYNDIELNTSNAVVTGVISVPGSANTNKKTVKVLVNKVGFSTIWVNTTFTNNMVLQRNKQVKIFGYGGDVDTKVKVSFNGQEKEGTVTTSGWAVYLDPMAASNVGKDLTITYGNQVIKFENVVVGEVLLCSGQSNMDISVRYIYNKDNSILEDYKTYNNYNKIRVLSIPYGEASTPQIYDYSRANWKACSSIDDVMDYSAYAMTVASHYQAVLGNVPVGVIVAAVGGSCIEEWLDKDSFTKYDLYSYASSMGKVDSRFYNSYIANIAGYSINGVVWYQGEANAQPRMVSDYKLQFKAYVDLYRTIFEDQNLPFIVQQLVRYDEWCEVSDMRIAQWEFMKTMKNVYTVCGYDTGDMTKGGDGIHPVDKWVLGARAAGLLALAHNVDKSTFAVDNPYGISPEIVSATKSFANGQTTIKVQTTADGKLTADGTITGLEIKVKVNGNITWKTVAARINSEGYLTFKTTYEEVLAIRYNFSNGYENGVFVYDDQGLPLAPCAPLNIKEEEPTTPPVDEPSDDDSEVPSDEPSNVPSEDNSEEPTVSEPNTNTPTKGCKGSANVSLVALLSLITGLFAKKKLIKK